MFDRKPISKEEMMTDIYYVISYIRPDILEKYDVSEKKFIELGLAGDRLFFKLIQRAMYRVNISVIKNPKINETIFDDED